MLIKKSDKIKKNSLPTYPIFFSNESRNTTLIFFRPSSSLILKHPVASLLDAQYVRVWNKEFLLFLTSEAFSLVEKLEDSIECEHL